MPELTQLASSEPHAHTGGAVDAPAFDAAHLRHVLRGLRSQTAAVRDWALAEAAKLDEPSARLLDGLVDRSFKDEKGRRRFWRFLAFWGTSAGVSFVVGQMGRVAGVHGGEVSLLRLIAWLVLWRMADRSAKRAFAPKDDGRVAWQEARKKARERSSDNRRGDGPGQRERDKVAMAGASPSSAVARALADGLLRGEKPVGARRLATEDLLGVAQELMAAYEQRSEPEDDVRARLSNWAFWIFLGGAFITATFYLFAGGLGLYALHYRDPEGRRALEALAWVLEVLRSERGVTVSALALTAAPDLTLLARMRRRCPALARLLPDTPGEAEEERPLSEEERGILRELSAEVLLSPLEHVEDTLSALKRLESIGDANVLPTVQRLAAWPARPSLRTPPSALSDYVRDARRIRAAAQRCLSAMHARPDIQEQVLLRASESPVPEGALLRPADLAPQDAAPETLLRAVGAEDEHPTAQAEEADEQEAETRGGR